MKSENRCTYSRTLPTAKCRESNGETKLWKKKKKYFHRHWLCRRDGELMVFPRAYAHSTYTRRILLLLFFPRGIRIRTDATGKQRMQSRFMYNRNGMFSVCQTLVVTVFRRIGYTRTPRYSYMYIRLPRCSQHKIAVLLDAAGLQHGHMYSHVNHWRDHIKWMRARPCHCTIFCIHIMCVAQSRTGCYDRASAVPFIHSHFPNKSTHGCTCQM